MNKVKKQLNNPLKTSLRQKPPAPKNTKLKKDMAEFSEAVGDFIRYWGFRRIHGQIWSQIYLSSQPLSGVQLTERLGVSKALVSPALTELLNYDLITLHPDGKKIKRYSANPDVFTVIKNILKHRELKLIQTAKSRFEKLQLQLPEDSAQVHGLDSDRIQNLAQMIGIAEMAVEFLIAQTHENTLDQWVEPK